MGVGDRECALMRAQNAHSTTYPALAPEGLDRVNPKLVQKLIGDMGTSYGSLRARSAQLGRCSRPARARSARTCENERESTGMDQGVATAASAKYEQKNTKQQKLRNLRQTHIYNMYTNLNCHYI
jgi:hypothetical protein